MPKDAKGNHSIDKACADPCLGVLPGVTLACCGHGVRENAHIVFENGVVIRGFDVIEHHRPRAPHEGLPDVNTLRGAQTSPSRPMTEANADLMAPIAEILNASQKDLPTKVGVLIDSAAALLATSKRMRKPSELRHTGEEMRKRLITVVRQHQQAFDERQENARARLEAIARQAAQPAAQRAPAADGADQPKPRADH